MPKKLSQKQIKQRLIRLRNLEQLYPIAKTRIKKLEKENKSFGRKIQQLQSLVQLQSEIIEKFKLRIEELEKMVFGKRNNKDKNKNSSDKNSGQANSKKIRRSRKSYRRPAPKPEDITDIVDYPLAKCPDCGSFLKRLKTIIRYIEDIRLPDKLKNFLKKQKNK